MGQNFLIVQAELVDHEGVTSMVERFFTVLQMPLVAGGEYLVHQGADRHCPLRRDVPCRLTTFS